MRLWIPAADIQDLIPKIGLGAELLDRPDLRLRLHRLYGMLSFTDSKMLPSYGFVGLDQLLAGSGPCRTGGAPSPISAIFASLYIIICYGDRPRSWPSCSTRRSASKGSCVRSISIRWRYPSSSPALPGNGSSIPASVLKTPCINGDGRAFHFNWIKDRNMAIYTRGDRRRLAVFRLRHGDVPGRAARRRQRDHQGRADRRRLDRHDLSPHHHSADAPGFPLGLRRARPSRHQGLRPCDRADRRRTWAGHRVAGDLHVLLHVHPQFRWASALRRRSSC